MPLTDNSIEYTDDSIQAPLITSSIADLCDKYNIDLQTVMDCMSNAIHKNIRDVGVIIDLKNNSIDTLVFKMFNMMNVDLSSLDKPIIKRIAKTFRYYLNNAKYQMLYDHFRHLLGTLVFGAISSKTHDGYLIEIGRDYLINIPLGTESVYPLMYQPVPERKHYITGDHIPFIIVRIQRAESGNMRLILSRMSPKLPAKIIEDELKISHVKILSRYPGVKTEIETNLNIPQKSIDHLSQLLKGEAIYVRKNRKK